MVRGGSPIAGQATIPGMAVPPPTPQLAFREMTPDDLDDMAALLGDPEVMRYYPHPKTRDEASAWISWNRQIYRRAQGLTPSGAVCAPHASHPNPARNQPLHLMAWWTTGASRLWGRL